MIYIRQSSQSEMNGEPVMRKDDFDFPDEDENDRRIAKGASWAIVATVAVLIVGLGYWKYASSGCDGIDGLITVCSGKGGIVISK